jgi:hypothetical protein
LESFEKDQALYRIHNAQSNAQTKRIVIINSLNCWLLLAALMTDVSLYNPAKVKNI